MLTAASPFPIIFMAFHVCQYLWGTAEQVLDSANLREISVMVLWSCKIM